MGLQCAIRPEYSKKLNLHPFSWEMKMHVYEKFIENANAASWNSSPNYGLTRKKPLPPNWTGIDLFTNKNKTILRIGLVFLPLVCNDWIILYHDRTFGAQVFTAIRSEYMQFFAKTLCGSKRFWLNLWLFHLHSR